MAATKDKPKQPPKPSELVGLVVGATTDPKKRQPSDLEGKAKAQWKETVSKSIYRGIRGDFISNQLHAGFKENEIEQAVRQ